ncbi:hypothetical protein SDC9_95137 [bioreactor metagenome]|uniref:Uncharacterized protein n=1 Tax=bioreactor metagenome TaxID=1076179 RepID=A0A645A5Q5_9ZZZZ
MATIDVPLDPDEQPDYRANRDIVEDDVAYEQMKGDASEGRSFSNIVAEYDEEHGSKYPIKIIGGQHRFLAIKMALSQYKNIQHGIKIYFNLSKDQRLDVQLISNRNIAVSTDLFDRLQETSNGPELRKWCQDVGFLDPGQDFSSKRQRSSAINVRAIRSFILNYFLGIENSGNDFEITDTTPVLCKTGRPDSDWEKFRKKYPKFWENQDLSEAAKEFVKLDQVQHSSIFKLIENNSSIDIIFADKALTFSVMNSWAYVAGLLFNNKTRLQRHFSLCNNSKNSDPLNALAMSKGRHKSDPENYRGLGTRNDAKERSRCVELFHLQAEKGNGITPSVIDLAIKRHFTKQAKLDELRTEKKVKSSYE